MKKGDYLQVLIQKEVFPDIIWDIYVSCTVLSIENNDLQAINTNGKIYNLKINL